MTEDDVRREIFQAIIQCRGHNGPLINQRDTREVLAAGVFDTLKAKELLKLDDDDYSRFQVKRADPRGIEYRGPSGRLLPCRGTNAGIFGDLAAVAIGLLFFLQGARLSRTAIIAGALHCGLDFMR